MGVAEMVINSCSAVTFFLLIFQMKSIRYNSSDSSLYLQTDTERPTLREGDVLIKVSLQNNYESLCLMHEQ